MNIILGRSFWLLHKLGWKPLAQFTQSSDMTSIYKSKISDVAHLSGTHTQLRLQIQKCFRVFTAPQWQHHYQCQSSCPTKAQKGQQPPTVSLDAYLKKHHSLWNLTSPTNSFEFSHTLKLLGTIGRVAQNRDSSSACLSLQASQDTTWTGITFLYKFLEKNILWKLVKVQSSCAEQTASYRLSGNHITALCTKPIRKKVIMWEPVKHSQ